MKFTTKTKDIKGRARPSARPWLRHGHTTHDRMSPTYRSWRSMLARCYNPKNDNYARYGGAGVTVCDRWRESFDAFLADMGERPAVATLDRKDNAKGYSPTNCRWATRAEQTKNRRVILPASCKNGHPFVDGSFSMSRGARRCLICDRAQSRKQYQRRTRGTSRTHPPVSTAKTAYGLLGEIAKLIVEEPKRYNQLSTLFFVDPAQDPKRYPACGTVGCVAGWTVALTQKNPQRFLSDVLNIARNTLGLDEDQSYELFRGEAAGDNPHTARHARVGARHINRFRRQHKAQLLRTRIPVQS